MHDIDVETLPAVILVILSHTAKVKSLNRHLGDTSHCIASWVSSKVSHHAWPAIAAGAGGSGLPAKNRKRRWGLVV